MHPGQRTGLSVSACKGALERSFTIKVTGQHWRDQQRPATLGRGLEGWLPIDARGLLRPSLVCMHLRMSCAPDTVRLQRMACPLRGQPASGSVHSISSGLVPGAPGACAWQAAATWGHTFGLAEECSMSDRRRGHTPCSGPSSTSHLQHARRDAAMCCLPGVHAQRTSRPCKAPD